MKVFVFLLLAMLPLAMGADDGDFQEMMEALEKEAKVKGWTDVGDDKKGDDDEKDCDNDREEEEELKKMMKELGMEMEQWREKMGELMKKSDWQDDGDDSHEKKDGDDDDSGEKKDDKDKEKPDPEKERQRMKLYKEFKEFLEYKGHEREAKMKKQEHFKKEVLQFKDYMKLKKMQEYEKQKKEMRKEKVKEYEETSYVLREKYMYISHEYMEARFNFTFSITNQVLDICQCDGRKGLMMRLRDGDFGKRDMGHGNQTTSHPTHSPSTTFPGSNSSHTPISTSLPPVRSSPNSGGNTSWSTPPPRTSSFPNNGGNTSWSTPPPHSSSSPNNGGNTSWSTPPPQTSSFPNNGSNTSWSTPPPHSSSSPNNSSGSPSSPTGSPSFPTGTSPPHGSSPFPTSSPGGGDEDHDDGGQSRDEIMEIVRRFAWMKPEEQFEFAFDQLSRNLCEAAGVYMEHVMEVEKAVSEYMYMDYGPHDVRRR